VKPFALAARNESPVVMRDMPLIRLSAFLDPG
jgi:hypothetical protein